MTKLEDATAELLEFVTEHARGECWCDHPAPGESGVIECERCIARRNLPVLEALVSAAADLYMVRGHLVKTRARTGLIALAQARAGIARIEGARP